MTSAAQGEKAVVDWLGGQRGAMLALLEELVNTDGGSYDKAGVDAVGGRIREFPRRARHRQRGDRRTRNSATPLRATVGGAVGTAPILLMGHRDTVFPEGRADAPAVQDRGRHAPMARASPT